MYLGSCHWPEGLTTGTTLQGGRGGRRIKEERSREGGREGGREGREGGREGGRQRGREGKGREKAGGREEGRQRGRESEREGKREGNGCCSHTKSTLELILGSNESALIQDGW